MALMNQSNPTFDETNLETRLRGVSNRSRAVFAAACAQKQVPNYAAFQSIEKWGDVTQLERPLGLVWEVLESGDSKAVPKNEFDECKQSCEEVIPDSDEFESSLAAYAQDAAASVIYSIEALESGDAKWPTLTGRLAYQAVEAYVSEMLGADPNNTLDVDIVNEHPDVQRELKEQDDLLTLLESHSDPTRDLVAAVRKQAAEEGLQPAKRGLL